MQGGKEGEIMEMKYDILKPQAISSVVGDIGVAC